MSRAGWVVFVLLVGVGAGLLTLDVVPSPVTRVTRLVRMADGYVWTTEDIDRARRAVEDRGAAFDGTEDALDEIEREIDALLAGTPKPEDVARVEQDLAIRRRMLEVPMRLREELQEELPEELSSDAPAEGSPPDVAARFAAIDAKLARLRDRARR